MALLSKLVAEEHKDDLAVLRAFAEKGDNRLHLIVGNHDATLRYTPVWEPIAAALNAGSGRINLVSAGLWVSADGRIVAEHGHQIGEDVNKYDTWPDIARAWNNKHYIVRPWGELFVQRLFNGQEAVYPIIDNLSPETAGARIRMADRGVWGTAVDMARLVIFNLMETSISQRQKGLGTGQNGPVTWNVPQARAMGASFLLSALPEDDALRVQIQQGGADAKAIESELKTIVERLPDEEIQHICDLAALQEPKGGCGDRTLGVLAQQLLLSKEKVLAKHLQARKASYPSMEVFIYGHTHQFEEPWKVELNDGAKIVVANTGAFQRLIDEPQFRTRLKGRTPIEGLKGMDLAELPACYGAIQVKSAGKNTDLKPEVRAWFMPEDQSGQFVSVVDEKCE